MKKRQNNLLFYAIVGIPVYVIFYLGIVGYGIIPNYFAGYQYSTYGIKSLIPNPLTFVPAKVFSPVYMFTGVLGFVGMYMHYHMNKRSYA